MDKLNETIHDPSRPPEGQPAILRCCIACRQYADRKTLIRVVHDRVSKNIYIVKPAEDKTVFSGRSSYICYAQSCVEKALKAKRLQKTLKTPLPDDIVKCLLQLL